MDGTAVTKIVELSAPNIVENHGFTFTDKNLSVIELPSVQTMAFRTLRGLVETLQNEYDNFNSAIIVNVRSHDEVIVAAGINLADRKREVPYRAEAELPSISFDRKLDYESMMIQLKSKFVETPELLSVIQLLGTITEENSAQASDDGFTQSVVVRKGIALKDNKVVKPIVKLKPYRTFLEVDQPESEFLLRLSDGGYVALFEADGGAWKLAARSNIATYLRDALKDLINDGNVIVVE